MLKTISIMVEDTSSYIDHKTGSQKENTLGRAGRSTLTLSIGIKRKLHYTTIPLTEYSSPLSGMTIPIGPVFRLRADMIEEERYTSPDKIRVVLS